MSISADTYRFLANAVFVVHILVVLQLIMGCVAIGTGFTRKHQNYGRFTCVFSALVVTSQLIFLGCPLVALEYSLRHQYDPNLHQYASFTVYLVQKLTGVEVPVIIITLITYFLVAISVTGWFLFRSPRNNNWRSS